MTRGVTLPLLGGKKEEANADDSKGAEEVPEELPDLPEDSADQESVDSGDPGGRQQDQGAVVPEQDLAPDELPPVESGQGELEEEPGPDSPDKRLYFSELLRKLNEDGIRSTKLTNQSVNLLSDMKRHWKERKKTEELEAMNSELKQNIAPLQKLEREWTQLQSEIEQKRQLLKEKEQKIQEMSENLKKLAKKTGKLEGKAD